jgi:serine/threonine protein kinase
VGRYELLEPLGVGGMAEVFKARTFGPGGFERQVVIKQIQPAHAADPDFVRMFIEEAKIMALLHHPNVVQVYDFAEDEGAPFLALEYIDGLSVSRVLRVLRDTGRQMPPAIAAYVGREICRALDYVHNLSDARGARLRIVHRDVTPSNIMLTSSGGLKLLDFGVAKSRGSEGLTRAGTVKGKPAYLAPEQLDGRKIDGRADLFALGIVLHEMLSLQSLFAGDRDVATLRRIREMPIPPPSARRPEVPPALDAVVLRALERDPGRRYTTAAEMARELDAVVVSSRLRVGEVVAFVAELLAAVERRRRSPSAFSPAPSAGRLRPPRAGCDRRGTERTVKDLGIRFRMSWVGLPGWTRLRARGTAFAGLALVVAALVTAVGLRAGVPASGTATKIIGRADPLLRLAHAGQSPR